MAVVTISRQFGAGGRTLGERLAAFLGYQLLDREILEQVAHEANVSVEWVETVEQQAGGLLFRLVHKLVSSDFIERHLGDSASDFNEEKYVAFIKKVMLQAAAEGDVVVVGRAGQFIFPEDEQTIKILLVADMPDRIKFMMEQYELSQEKAETLVRKAEKRRTNFLRRFYDGDLDDPSVYSLVINTSRISLAEAETVVIELLGSMADRFAKPIW